MKKNKVQSGFTLIELIAVMVILGILAAVIVPRISTLTSGAYESNGNTAEISTKLLFSLGCDISDEK